MYEVIKGIQPHVSYWTAWAAIFMGLRSNILNGISITRPMTWQLNEEFLTATNVIGPNEFQAQLKLHIRQSPLLEFFITQVKEKREFLWFQIVAVLFFIHIIPRIKHYFTLVWE